MKCLLITTSIFNLPTSNLDRASTAACNLSCLNIKVAENQQVTLANESNV